MSGAGDFRNGRTPYDRLTIALKLARGIATVEDIRIEGPAVRLLLGGSASIPSRDIDLSGTAQLIAAANDAGGPFELPFVVQGPWDDPVMLPDTQSLISRSGAAAPLLNAVAARARPTRCAAPSSASPCRVSSAHKSSRRQYSLHSWSAPAVAPAMTCASRWASVLARPSPSFERRHNTSSAVWAHSKRIR